MTNEKTNPMPYRAADAAAMPAAAGAAEAAGPDMAAPVITPDDVARGTELLRRYKDGKRALEARIIADEQWYRLRHWQYLRGPAFRAPAGCRAVPSSAAPADLRPSSARPAPPGRHAPVCAPCRAPVYPATRPQDRLRPGRVLPPGRGPAGRSRQRTQAGTEPQAAAAPQGKMALTPWLRGG